MPHSFPLLLAPLQSRAKTVRNRILITGHVPRLADNGKEFCPDESLLALEGQAVRLVDLYSGAESRIGGVELLVSWQGRLPRNDPAEAAGRSGARVIVVGDAVAPRSVTQAVAEGALAARSI